jgi:uncharacterized protein DUF4304
VSKPAERFNRFMRLEIAPALRSMGLRGSAQRFELPDDRCWALVGFQRSWTNAITGEARFTVNLTFVPKAAWDLTREQLDWVGPKPSANSSAGFRGVEVLRLGNLMPGGEDRWWNIEHPDQEASVAKEVLTAIRDLGLPWLRSQMQVARGAARLD